MAVKAIASGAYDFLEKPCGPSAFLAVVTRALKARSLVLENRRLAAVVAQGDAASRLLRGVSPQADELRSQSRRVAALGTDALITGDRGSGTAKVAEVVHLLSPAAARAFVKQSAGQLDVSSLAHVLDRAAGGTLYLDEITRLPEDVQYALLDLIEGGAGARILAGTTVPIEPGDLLEDLFYHFDILRIHIPPLRGRKVDIPVLFRHYVEQACEQANLPMPDIGSEVIARLMAQDWPGNARALVNAAMRFAMGLDDTDDVEEQGLAVQMAAVERSLLIAALQRNQGRAGDTATDLMLARKTFYDKLARHNLRCEDYRM
jgi:two-component system C4-dicarboxylate transport response regulator DctD